MWALEVSFVRNETSIELSLSMCPCAIRGKRRPSARRHGRYPSPGRGVHLRSEPFGPVAGPASRPARLLRRRRSRRETVENALDLYGKPVYVRKEIVHNKHVVLELEKRGAIFVEEETEVPEGEMVVFSAHGVAPSVHANAAKRGLRTIDATCPLVTKVHVEARKFAAEGYTIVLVGHEGHEEVEGTTGEAPEQTVLVQTEADVDELEVEDPDRIAYITRPPSRSTRPARSSPA